MQSPRCPVLLARLVARALAGAAIAASALAQLRVTSITPASHSQSVDPRAPIIVTFDRPLDPASLPPSVPSVIVASSILGPLPGAFTLENSGATLRFEPARACAAGEIVQIELTTLLRAADQTSLRRAGSTSRHRIGARAAPLAFELAQDLDVRDTAGVLVRIYGAALADLDGDLSVDLPVICEDASDVRVLMSRDDGTCRFDGPLLPALATGLRPSPNEVADLDGDGVLDLVCAATLGNVLSIARGRGDGTFDPRVDVPTGLGPRGLAVFDADGDGDLDCVTANSIGDNLALVRNQGGGSWAAPVFFEAGGSGEYGLAAGDMDEDGILDLVVGARFSQRVLVLRGNGNGTFALASSTYCGGSAWQIALGDLDGDRHLDVTVANSGSANAGVLFGDGSGGLGGLVVHPTPAYTVATDLGDLDGDGDLDWVVSCHTGGVWRLLENDGAGAFTHVRDFSAPQSPACAALADLDGDRDLDLVLLDELADRVQLWRNGAEPATYRCSGDGADELCPCGNAGAIGHGCAHSQDPAGARLLVQGDLGLDLGLVDASSLPRGSLCIFLAGDALAPATPFGDGLLCAGGSLLRFGRQVAVAGSASYPAAGQPTLSFASATAPGSGALRVYQAYFRNAAAFCTSATFNATNAAVVVW